MLYPVESFATSWQRSLITSSALIGNIAGMLTLGALSDRVGRRELMLCTSSLTFVGTLGAACAFDPGGDGIWSVIIFFRFIMGFGIGGEYPLSAALTAESSDAHSSGFELMLVCVCAWACVRFFVTLFRILTVTRALSLIHI